MARLCTVLKTCNSLSEWDGEPPWGAGGVDEEVIYPMLQKDHCGFCFENTVEVQGVEAETAVRRLLQ